MNHVTKATILIDEALPYLQKFQGKIVIIKYGGKAMVSEELLHAVMKDVAFLKAVGILPVLVHGGGPEASKKMEKKGAKPIFINGLRVTDAKTVHIVKGVFGGINRRIRKTLGLFHVRSEGVLDGFEVEQKDERLGFVGEVKKVRKGKIMKILREGKIPVISPLGKKGSQTYNINADTAAMEVAAALKAEKLTILTDVDGIMSNGSFVATLSIADAQKCISKGVITRGMIPKVEACIEAVNAGCRKAHLLNGTVPHSLLFEIFTEKGVGTEIVK